MEIKQGNSVIVDTLNKVHDVDGAIVCCGKTLTMVSHLDGRMKFTTVYKCKCGNTISVTTERESDSVLWRM